MDLINQNRRGAALASRFSAVIIALVTLTSVTVVASASKAESNMAFADDSNPEQLTCTKPKSNPYVCPWRIRPDRQSEAWLGVNDKTSRYDVKRSPIYLGIAYGGSTMCDRFSAYFYDNRANLKTAACHIAYYGDADAPTALIYVNIKGQHVPKTLPPTDPELEWLYMGFASPKEIKIRAETALRQCQTVLAFVKYYENSCQNPR